MKCLKGAVAVCVASLFCAIMLPTVTAHAQTTGSLQVTPGPSGASIVYDAYRVADEAALPCDNQFRWSDLSGKELDGRPAYPTYDPAAGDAARDGRELVERVSRDVSTDDAGVLAQKLVSFLAEDASPDARVTAGAGPVFVRDGWYLLRASGRRPLFAWVDGAPVTLGDKSDAPVLGKQVSCGSGWSDGVVAGQKDSLSYRVDTSVPLSVDAGGSYPVTIVDTWDERLLLNAESVRVTLMHAGSADESQVITDQAEISIERETLSVSGDFLAWGAKPGDVVRLSYEMSFDPHARLDGKGAANTAFATYRSWLGDSKTPVDETRVYGMQLELKKVDKGGKPLAGAVLALRNADGWLDANGAFGEEGRRIELVSDADGMVEIPAMLSSGPYEVVELQAPAGFRKEEKPIKLELAAECAKGALTLRARASSPLRVADVDADRASVTCELVNERASQTTLGFVPQTGETLWLTAVVVMAAAGCLVIRRGFKRLS